MCTETRWKQRFQSFDRVYRLFRSSLEERSLDDYSDLERDGLTRRFKSLFELAWKTMKDYLEHGGLQISPVTPKNVIKEAFAAKLIDDGQIWIDMMLDRNLLSHAYDQKKFRTALDSVKNSYLPKLEQLHQCLMHTKAILFGSHEPKELQNRTPI